MTNKLALLLATVALALLSAVACAQDGLNLKAENTMPKGWGSEGWGGYKFTLKNASAKPAKLVKWTAHWEAKGKKVGDEWGDKLDVTIAPGAQVVRDEAGVLPANVIKLAAPGNAEMVGAFTYEIEGKQSELTYRFEIKEAKLPEPLKLIKGKTVGVNVMASRYKTFKHMERTLLWLDQSYQAMIDLTGEKPFGGRLMVFKEAPPHPWWAYAGEEMILNTDYVGATLKDFDDGLISFGWVHEVGHNFDTLGDWYIWSGPAAEFQANFKLSYAFESIADQSFRIKWGFQAPDMPASDKEIRLTGKELVEKFFVMFGDKYLADPTRKWDTLSSDEMHTMFQRIQRVYGWDVHKNWYRTYRKLADAGKKPPEKAEDKISLIAAILSRETKVDLIPVFQRWRFPITPASVDAMRKTYGIEAPPAQVKK